MSYLLNFYLDPESLGVSRRNIYSDSLGPSHGPEEERKAVKVMHIQAACSLPHK